MIPLSLTNLARRVGRMFGALPSGFPDEWQVVPDLLVNEDGWLEGAGVERIPMHPSWGYRRLSTPTGDPLAIVAHYSATEFKTARNMANRRTVQRTAKDRAASWHISVEGDGSIVQMASCEAGTWHAGGTIKGLGSGNRVSVGIELIGWGKAFPQAQVLSAARVWRAIVQSYGIQRRWAMVPHSAVHSGKNDPGPVWAKEHAENVLEYAFA